MGKNVPLSEVERAQIVALHKEGHSERLISQKMKKSKTAVHNAMAKFRNTGTYRIQQLKNLVDLEKPPQEMTMPFGE